MGWLRHWQFRRTTLWLVLCLAVLAGIGLAHTGFHFSLFWIWPCLIISLVTRWQRTSLTLIFMILLGLSLGCWRGGLYMQKLADYQPFYGQKVTLTVQAIDDGVYGKNSQVSFDANKLQLDDGEQLTGKIEVSGFGPAAVFQGDEFQVSGKLYPGLGQYQGFISFAQLTLMQHHPSLVAQIRRKFTAGMQTALPEPLAPFAMGLLIGQRATLPANIKQDLLMVGLTHIIAVSGYNLTIMLHASRRLLGKRSKRISTFLSLGLIGVFLLLAGSSASIVRAAIVSVLSIAATYYGRSFRPLNLIMLAAAITAWASPFYVWSDTSWYLSFLAFYGVMILAPIIQARWPHRWHDSIIVGVALESICAELMTLPFVLFTFGQISLIGLPANVLVVTLVPLAMLLSTIAGLCGMLASSIAGWVAWPARILLTYMLDISHLLASVPHIFRQHLSLPIPLMIGLYLILIGLTSGLWVKTKRLKYATITDKNETNHEEQLSERS